jgi:hypothetical protein
MSHFSFYKKWLFTLDYHKEALIIHKKSYSIDCCIALLTGVFWGRLEVFCPILSLENETGA